MTRRDALRLLKLAEAELQYAEREIRERRAGALRRHVLAKHLFRQAQAQALLHELSAYTHVAARA